MKLIKLTCPNCGAKFKVDENKKEFLCEFCGTTTMLDDEVIRVEHRIVGNSNGEGLKAVKSLGMTTLIIFGVIAVSIIAVIGLIVFNFNKNDQVDNQNDIQLGDIFDDSQIDNAFSEVEIRAFNGTFELYSGTQSDFFVDSLLDNVVTNNKTKKEHMITVVYNENNTTDPDEIVKIKQSLEDDSEYEVSLDYDQDGFVNKVTLTKID